MRYLEKNYIKAGKIAKEAIETGKRYVKAGKPYFDVVKGVEGCIQKRGAFPAFPVNVSVNNVGAHYTPYPNDGLIFKTGDLVKIDVGCHVDGYIADTALTVEVDTDIHRKMINATERALESAIKMAEPGLKVKNIGAKIEEVIQAHGYRPIRNLTGHRMERYVLHSGLSIPNVKSGRGVLEEGMVVAIEPFATNGQGRVVNGQKGEIYILRKKRKLPKDEEDFYRWLHHHFNSLPFASYWCHTYSDDYVNKLLQLERRGVVMSYPLLMEEGGGIVSQREHTLMITKEGAKVLTG